MTDLRAMWLVARWEFTSTVRRPSFIASLIGLPLAHFALAALIGLSVRTVAEQESSGDRIAIVDATKTLAVVNEENGQIVRDKNDALRALRNGELERVFVLDDKYLESGRVDEYSRGSAGLLEFGRQLAQRQRAEALMRKGLAQDQSPRGRRLLKPIASLDSYRVRNGSIRQESALTIVAMLAGPFGISLVLGLAIFLAAGLLQQAMESELQNKMLEVVLSIITPAVLLTGKVFGLSAAGLLQLAVYLSTAIVAGPMFAGGTGIPVGTLIWSGAVFLAGYMLFAVLLAGSGALARDAQESTQVASLWLLLAATPLFLVAQIGANPSSMLARALTWFPPTAPVALLLRIGFDGVGILERTAATTAVLIAIFGALRLSAALFRVRALSDGRITLRHVFPPSRR